MTPTSSSTCPAGCATRTGGCGRSTATTRRERTSFVRLIAITNASKHDLSRASQRLDSLVADLDAGRYDDDGE
jgi:hypothetical protein